MLRVVTLLLGAVFLCTSCVSNQKRQDPETLRKQILKQQYEAQVPLLPKRLKKKIWELTDYVNYRTKDGIAIFMIPSRVPTPKSFGVQTGDVGGSKDISVAFSGECAKRVNVTVKVIGSKDTDLSTFEKTQAIADLPIQRHLNAMRSILLLECDDMDAMHVQVNAMRWGYAQGEMQALNGWKLQDTRLGLGGKPVYNIVLTQGNIAGAFELGSDHSIKGYFSNINARRDNAHFEGQFNFVPPADPTKTSVVAYQSQGEWHAIGGTGAACQTPRNGYAHWGSYEFKLTSDGYMSLTYCPGEPGENTIKSAVIFSEMQVGLKRFPDYEAKKQIWALFDPEPGDAIQADEKLIAQRDAEAKKKYGIKWDSNNKLVYLKFRNSRYLFTDNNIDFYVAEDPTKYFAPYPREGYPLNTATFVAVHHVGDDEPVLDVKTRLVFNYSLMLDSDYFSGNDEEYLSHQTGVAPIRPQYQLTESALRYWSEIIPPRLTAAAPGINPYTISHYTPSKALFNVHEMTRTMPQEHKPEFILPVIYTWMQHVTDQITGERYWRSAAERPHGVQTDNDKKKIRSVPASLGTGYGLTVNMALDNRRFWNKDPVMRARLRELSPQAFQSYLKKRRNERDQLLNKEAEKLGVLYKSFDYWSGYHNKEEMKAIFDGRSLDGLMKDANFFAYLYVTLNSWFSGQCSQLIPEGSPWMSWTDITIVTQGGWTDRYVGPTHKVYVRQRYWDRYKYYNDHQGDLGLASILFDDPFSANFKSTITNAIKFITDLAGDMDKFYGEHACDSDVFKQFDENLYRMATGQATLQEQQRQHQNLKPVFERGVIDL